MFKSTAAIILLSVFIGQASARPAVQTDWSGGGGQPGPVTQWEDRFDSVSDLSWLAAPGQLALSCELLETPRDHLIDDAYMGAFGLKAADFDLDGDMDLVGSAEVSGVIAVWFNDGAAAPGWTRQVVESGFNGAGGVDVADIDGDGRPDILACAAGPANRLAWWRNVDSGGAGVDWDYHAIAVDWPGCYEINTGDVDGDGRIDLLAASWDLGDLAWWRNDPGDPDLWTRQTVDANLAGAHCLAAGDLDGDGDTDLAGAGADANQIVWYRNDGGDPIDWVRLTVRTGFNGARSVRVNDLDGDGDLDLAAVCWSSHVAWWRNDGGSPIAWTEEILTSAFPGGHSLEVGDMNGDGRPDLLAAAWSSGCVSCWLSGAGAWTRHDIDTGLTQAITVAAGDVDGGGALDVLAVSYYRGEFKWYEIGSFLPSGSLESAILDAGSGHDLTRLDWTAHLPTGTGLRCQARSGDAADALGAWSADLHVPGEVEVPGRFIQYRVLLDTTDPEVSPVLREIRFEASATGIADDGTPQPGRSRLLAWPNPFNPRVNLTFSLAQAGFVRLGIYDIHGRCVALLADRKFPEGRHDVPWSGIDEAGKSLPTGIYFARLQSDGGVDSRKLVLVR